MHSCGKSYLYLASILEMDKPFTEQFSDPFLCKSSLLTLLSVKIADFLRMGSGAVSFLSIEITSRIVGLSAALSCKHKRATWMNLSNWCIGHESFKVGSIMSFPESLCHKSHALNRHNLYQNFGKLKKKLVKKRAKSVISFKNLHVLRGSVRR